MSSLTSEKHRSDLEQFGELLVQEAYEVQLVPAAGVVPYDTLMVKLDLLWLELSFLPGLEDELDDVSILQCFVAVCERTVDAAGFERLIGKLNAKLPIGGFGLLDDPQVLFFKHNSMLPNDDRVASFQIVHELVAMSGYLIGVFSSSLIEVATGEKTVDAAMSDMPFRDVIG